MKKIKTTENITTKGARERLSGILAELIVTAISSKVLKEVK